MNEAEIKQRAVKLMKIPRFPWVALVLVFVCGVIAAIVKSHEQIVFGFGAFAGLQLAAIYRWLDARNTALDTRRALVKFVKQEGSR